MYTAPVTRWLLPVLICGAVPAMAQSSPPFVYSALSTADYSRNLAQGSLFIVFGTGMGPSQLVQAGAYPLNAQLAGTSMTVMSGTSILPCPMVYTSEGVAAAVLPSNTPVGQAMLTLTYNGQPSPFPVYINVVATSPGIYTSTSSGLGPGVFTALDGAVKNFAATAKPGETVTAWATGLGPIAGPDNVLPSTFPNFPGVQVYVGTQAAKVIYAGRSGCCSGVDQISFVVPDGISGCYLPVAVESGGVFSNFVSISVDGAGGACSDSGPTLPVTLANRVNAGQTVNIAALAVGPVAILRGLGFNTRLIMAAKLSALMRVSVAPGDVDRLIRAGQFHDQRAMNRILAKYSAAWKSLTAAQKAAVGHAISLTQEGALADFGQFQNATPLAAAVSGLFPTQGTCGVSHLERENLQTGARGLDAGPSLSLSGQAGSWTLMRASLGQYQALFGNAPVGPSVPSGLYMFGGGGGQDVGSFQAAFTVGTNLAWTNSSAVASVDRTQPLTVTWSGGSTPGSILIGAYSESQSGGDVLVTCAEDVSKGTFTIPSFVLSAMPASTSGFIFLNPHPMSRQIPIPGIDLSIFIDGSTNSKSVAFH